LVPEFSHFSKFSKKPHVELRFVSPENNFYNFVKVELIDDIDRNYQYTVPSTETSLKVYK